MPQELLRDVLRTDDAAGRSRRRWVLFPTSVAVHAVAAVAYFIIPLAADVTMPTPASLLANRRWVMPVAPTTPSPPALQPPRTLSTSGAPTEAPSKLAPEVPPVAEIPAPGALEGPGVESACPMRLELEPEVKPLPADRQWIASRSRLAARSAHRNESWPPRPSIHRLRSARRSKAKSCWRHSSTSRVG